jgi:hypothetical protein
MADNRYRNGIKKSTAIQLERPTDHGWTEAGINPKTGRMVWTQDGCYLTRLFAPGWFVKNRQGVEYHITGATLQQVTEFILNDPHVPVACIECNNAFDSRLPDTPEPIAPICDVCLKESIVNVPLAA